MEKKIKKFEFTEMDEIGEETLLSIAQAHKFNKWMYRSIQSYCKGSILELGSGIGNITTYFLNDKRNITASDIRVNYRNFLVKNIMGNAATIELDMVHPDFEQAYAAHINAFDTVFALNVLEHVEDDATALRNCKKLLKKNGHLIILVPAYQALYNKIDFNLMHFRRYTKSSLRQVFENAELSVVHTKYFNFMGIFAWFISGKLLKNNNVESGKMKLYNSLVPVFKIIDACLLNKVGLSVIMVGIKE